MKNVEDIIKTIAIVIIVTITFISLFCVCWDYMYVRREDKDRLSEERHLFLQEQYINQQL